MRLVYFLLVSLGAAYAQNIPNIRDTQSCPNYPNGRPPLNAPNVLSGDMRKVVINSPGAVCNDGTPAVIYVRPAAAGASEPDGPSANRWLIHIEGGGNCNTYEDCGIRWCGLDFYTAAQMSSSPARDFINPGGLLHRDGTNRLADRNLVLVNYCSSDTWQGRKSDVVLHSETDPSKAYSVHFQGATIVSAALDALEKGVTGMPKLTEATDVLLSGDSAGATAVRTHLDRVNARLKANNPNVRVRGQMEATFFPDLNGKQGFPAGDPRDPVFPGKVEKFNRLQIGLLNAQLDDSCVAAHPGDSAYLCADNGFVELNHITTPFFQIQDLQDPGMLEDFAASGATGTVALFSQTLFDQMTGLANIRNTAVEKASINFTPGIAARNCGVHVTWGDDDGFLGKKIRSGPGATPYSYYDLLWNWLTGVSPSVVLEPRPPSTPEVPLTDPICGAKTFTNKNSASYSANTLAPDMIAFGEAAGIAKNTVVASSNPWPTDLGGVRITVTDSQGTSRVAPIYFVTPNAFSYLVPAGTALGPATLTLNSSGLESYVGTAQIETISPGLFTANASGSGVPAGFWIRAAANGAQTYDYLYDPNAGAGNRVPVPVDLGSAGDQVFLSLYGTGFRGATSATATVGGLPVPVPGFAAVGIFQGEDVVNVGPLPRELAGRKEVNVVLSFDNKPANTVTVSIR